MNMSDAEYRQFHDDRYNETPPELLARVLAIFDESLGVGHLGYVKQFGLKERLRAAYHSDEIYWLSVFHFGWGILPRYAGMPRCTIQATG